VDASGGVRALATLMADNGSDWYVTGSFSLSFAQGEGATGFAAAGGVAGLTGAAAGGQVAGGGQLPAGVPVAGGAPGTTTPDGAGVIVGADAAPGADSDRGGARRIRSASSPLASLHRDAV